MEDVAPRNSGHGAEGRLQFRDGPVPPVVLHIRDHPLGRGQALPRLPLLSHRQEQPRKLHMPIRLMQPHPTPLGNRHHLVQVSPGAREILLHPVQFRAGQQALRKIILATGPTYSINGLIQFLFRRRKIAAAFFSSRQKKCASQ